jgi:hypothetical protein
VIDSSELSAGTQALQRRRLNWELLTRSVRGIDRALHFLALSASGLLVLVFSADRETLRATFYKVFVTTSLLPLEIYEIANRATPFKVIAFLINLAVVIYLLLGKRLFGIRGGPAAEDDEIDWGWEMLERTAPPTSSAR